MATRSLTFSRSKHIGSICSKLRSQLGTIRTMVVAVDEERERLTALMIEQERAGITEATPHYRHGKYLSLVHPSKNGTRRSEYIGSNIHQVRDTLEKVANYKKFCGHLDKLISLECHAEKLSLKLDRLIKSSKEAEAIHD